MFLLLCHKLVHNVSPAIFGSLFQYVMDKDQRRHDCPFTTEENILKVIKPLFLDDLRNEFHVSIIPPKIKPILESKFFFFESETSPSTPLSSM